MSDVELLATGAYSPLEGFMGEADYRGVLHSMRLANGVPWTVPITLAVRKAAANAVREGQEIALVTPWEEHWIADIGIEGKKTNVEGTMVDAYYFCVGGGLGKHQRTARPVGYRAAATEVPAAIERLLNAYLAERRDGQSFRDFTARHTDEVLRELLAGAAVGAVERDASPGRPPHGVDA